MSWAGRQHAVYSEVVPSKPAFREVEVLIKKSVTTKLRVSLQSITNHMHYKIEKKTSIYKGPFKSFGFYFGKYKVTNPFSKNPSTFGKE